MSSLGRRSVRSGRQRVARNTAGHCQVACELPEQLPVTEAEQKLVSAFLADLITDILSEP